MFNNTAEIINGVTIAVVGAAILFIVGFMWRMLRGMNRMIIEYEDQKYQNNLLFKAVLAIMTCLRKGNINGEITDVEEELTSYLRNKATTGKRGV